MFERKSHGLGRLLTSLTLVVFLLTVLSVSSCKTLRTTEQNSITKTDSYHATQDSVLIIQHDSVFIRERGDSVLKTKYVYRDRIFYKTDSIRLLDTVMTAVVHKVPVEKELSKTQKAAIASGWILWVLLLLILLYILYKLIKH